MTTILIAGDTCPIGSPAEYFMSGNVNEIFHDLLPEFQNADIATANLECPLTQTQTPIPKSGVALRADPATIRGFIKANVKILSMANNHIMDYGEAGLFSTIDCCTNAGMIAVGVGRNVVEAQKPAIVAVNGTRIAFYAMAEHEFSIADFDTPGANPFDIITFARVMKQYKDEFDFMVVLLHAGKEIYPYPSPELQKKCRFMVESGAGAVICQHTHCAGCYEPYLEGLIVYGQGNFIFESSFKEQPCWFSGFLVKLKIGSPSDGLSWELIPYYQSFGCIGAQRMPTAEAGEFIEAIEKRREQIQDEKFVRSQWRAVALESKNNYLSTLYCLGHVRHRLARYAFFERIMFPSKSILRSMNAVQCESHNELVNTIFSIIYENMKGKK